MTQLTTTSLDLKIAISTTIINSIGNTGLLRIYATDLTTLLVEFTLGSPFGTIDFGSGFITGSGTPLLATAFDSGVATVGRYTDLNGNVVLETNIGLGLIPFSVLNTTKITVPFGNYQEGDLVTLQGLNLPTGLATSTEYEVFDIVDAGLSTCNFSLFNNRVLVTTSSNGSGTMSITDNAGIALNVGTTEAPSLTISSGQVISLGSIVINPPL